MGLELLFLLLPVAAFTGWWIGRGTPGHPAQEMALDPEYFRGLSYLINEQPDRAIEVFTRMLEVNSETVEVHIALGNLFRQRGEVDRSIRIHQNLIARPALTGAQRGQALFELGQDYMRAGLLDRAENLFNELSDNREYAVLALRKLIDIYQREKEWNQAIAVSRRLEGFAGQPLNTMVAQYFCELAELSRKSRDYSQAMKLVRQALAEDRNCARASILEGDLLKESNKLSDAIRVYKKIEAQDSTLISEIVERIVDCHRKLDSSHELVEYLRAIYEKYPDESVMRALASLLREVQGEAAAFDLINDYLRKRPSISGLSHLLKLKLDTSFPSYPQELVILSDMINKALSERPAYHCGECGFSANSLYWQCPGCQRWNTIRMIQSVK